jgi:hypothetical protein
VQTEERGYGARALQAIPWQTEVGKQNAKWRYDSHNEQSSKLACKKTKWCGGEKKKKENKRGLV